MPCIYTFAIYCKYRARLHGFANCLFLNTIRAEHEHIFMYYMLWVYIYDGVWFGMVVCFIVWCDLSVMYNWVSYPFFGTIYIIIFPYTRIILSSSPASSQQHITFFLEKFAFAMQWKPTQRSARANRKLYTMLEMMMAFPKIFAELQRVLRSHAATAWLCFCVAVCYASCWCVIHTLC